jgi:purine-binding chemotaxis protein CheW
MNRDLHIVGFRVGRETYGVPITTVLEIVRVPEITAVPDAPEHIEGVINLRGKIVSVIDLRKRFGEKSVVPSKKNRILVTGFQGKLAGLIVDSATEVLKIPAAEVEAPPSIFKEGGLHCVTGVGKLKGRLIVLLDMDKLLESDGQRRRPGADPAGPAGKAAAAGQDAEGSVPHGH